MEKDALGNRRTMRGRQLRPKTYADFGRVSTQGGRVQASSPKLAADERELASHIQVATQWDQLAKPMAEVEAAKEAAKIVKER